MKKIFLFTFIFLFSFNIVFAAKISKINFSSSTLSINLSSAKDEDLIVSADEDTRLVYVEISNLDSSSLKKVENSLENKMLNSGFFDNVIVDKSGNTLSFTMQLSPKISFFIDSSKKGIKIDFEKSSKNKKLIVIDPGHGGKDPGAVRGNIREKDIVIAVGTYLKDELLDDFNIIMTRNADFFVTLSERPKIANKRNARLFVSIHANASVNKNANGVEVFYFSKKSSPYAERIANFENSFGDKYGESSDNITQIAGELAYKKNQEESIKLAKYITDNISDSLKLKNGGVHGANFAVLRGFNGTGVLVELGFVSNSYDAKIITDKSSQVQLAKEIAKSIRQYLR